MDAGGTVSRKATVWCGIGATVGDYELGPTLRTDPERLAVPSLHDSRPFSPGPTSGHCDWPRPVGQVHPATT